MSLVINSLRGHFFKHLICTTTTTAAARLSRHRNCHFIRPNSFSFLFSERRQPWSLGSEAAAFSTSLNPSSSSLETPTADSFTSPYLVVHIRCPKNVADMLSEALLCFGASSTGMDVPENNEAHDEVCISSTFSVCQDVKQCLSYAADSIGLKEIPSYDVVMLDHTDWIKETQESFHPVEVMEGLWIVPEWRKPPYHLALETSFTFHAMPATDCGVSGFSNDPYVVGLGFDLQATNIILNPALAFGNGEHPTTKLCMLLLRDSIKGGELFLDYGTGSGILAIAAVKFGAAFSVGLDIDPQAVTSARHNASLNGIQPERLYLNLVYSNSSSTFIEEISAEERDMHHLYDTRVPAETQKFDVVIANILLNPLLDLADKIVSYAKPGATVGLSGIISEQIPCIIERYSEFLEGIKVSKMDDWACISGSKKET